MLKTDAQFFGFREKHEDNHKIGLHKASGSLIYFTLTV